MGTEAVEPDMPIPPKQAEEETEATHWYYRWRGFRSWLRCNAEAAVKHLDWPELVDVRLATKDEARADRTPNKSEACTGPFMTAWV